VRFPTQKTRQSNDDITKNTNPVTTHPSFSSIISNKCRFNLLVLNFHALSCPSVLLKYALPPFSSGGTYQLPHLSFATNGLPFRRLDCAAEDTNAASEAMDVRRLWMVRGLRLREVRGEGWEARGKMREQ
jgi:hypothetical protein